MDNENFLDFDFDNLIKKEVLTIKVNTVIEENINIKTKRLGKKQITWFKKEDRLKMINSENPDDVYKDIMEIINE